MLLAAALLLGDLGGPGLTDPWEMNPAHLARKMASPPLVLVGAREDDGPMRRMLSPLDAPKDAGARPKALLRWLPGKGTPSGPAPDLASGMRRMLAAVSTRDYHAVILPTPAATKGVDETVRQAWGELSKALRTRLPGSPVLFLGPGSHEIVAALPPAGVHLDAAANAEELASWSRGLGRLPWLLARIPGKDRSWGTPPLRYWLTAASYRALGFTELATRAPGAILGVLLVGLLFLLGLWMGGLKVASLAALILMGSPWLPIQARSMAGDLGFAVWLCLAAAGLVQVIYGRLFRGLVAYAAGFVLLFLDQGLFGAGVLLIMVLTFAFLEWRRRAWLVWTAGVSTVAFGILAFVVLQPEGWTFFSHFRAMAHSFEGGLGESDRGFDFLILQAGYAFLPWIALLPFALASLAKTWWDRGDHGDATRGLLLLWIVVPFTVLAATIEGFGHYVFPSGPAVALAVALFVVQMGKAPRPWPILALFAFFSIYLLESGLKLSPHPLMSTVTWDPPFVFEFKELHRGVMYPEAVQIQRSFRLLALVFMLALLYSATRGGAVLEGVRARLRSARLYNGVLFGLATLLLIAAAAGLGLRLQTLILTSPRIENTWIRAINFVVWVRPETWILYLALALYSVAAIAASPSAVAWLQSARGVGGRSMNALLRLLGAHPQQPASISPDAPPSALLWAVTAGALVLAVALLTRGFLHGGPVAALVGDPALILAFAGVATLLFLARRRGRLVSNASLLGLAGLLLYVAFRARRALGPADILSGVTAFLVGLALLRCALPLARRSALGGRGFVLGALLLLYGALMLPMANLLQRLAPQGSLPGVERYPRELLLRSPFLFALLRDSTWIALLPALAVLAGLAVTRWPLAARTAHKAFAFIVRADSPDRILPLLAVCGLGMSAILVFRYLPELSLHVSQKHILDRYYQAEGRTEVGENLFRHGRFGSGSRRDRNFYIQSIPDVGSQSDVLDLLRARRDVAVRLTASSFAQGPSATVFRAFDPANDRDGDRRRDFLADAGVAEDATRGTLTDEDKDWEPDQWKGKLLLDGRGTSHIITGNDRHTLRFEGSFEDRAGGVPRAYAIDDPAAPVHTATAMGPARAFVMIPKSELSALNFAFRRAHRGASIPVLDDRSSSLILTTSWLADGEEDRNWITKALITRAKMRAMPDFRASRVRFDDKLILEGWSVDDPMLKRGTKATIHFYFRVKAGVARSYKVFVHIDHNGGANRIGADHWVLNLPGNDGEKTCVGCFRTNHWLKGDIIQDTFTFEVPFGTPSGPQVLNMGLYEPNSGQRLRIDDYDKKTVIHDGNNRVNIGTLTVL